GGVIVAEPKALVGFAGARVIRQTIGEDLPPGFQRAEFVLEKGFVDRIVHRKQMREEVSRLLEFFWRSHRGLAAVGNAGPDAPPASKPASSHRLTSWISASASGCADTGPTSRSSKRGSSASRACPRGRIAPSSRCAQPWRSRRSQLAAWNGRWSRWVWAAAST